MGGKFQLTLILLTAVLRALPQRGFRILLHFPALFTYLRQTTLYGLRLRGAGRLLFWLGEIPFYILDLIGFPEWYEIGNLWLKSDSRALSAAELGWAKRIFGDTLPYARIRIDERAHIGPRQYRFCYVSFCVVNSWEEMSLAVFIHELVHVWQFRRFGSAYILRALLAQRTLAGYDYGGIGALRRMRKAGLTLTAFNYEQQASIVEDFFRLQFQGYSRWGRAAGPQDLETYRYFISALTEIHF